MRNSWKKFSKCNSSIYTNLRKRLSKNGIFVEYFSRMQFLEKMVFWKKLRRILIGKRFHSISQAICLLSRIIMLIFIFLRNHLSKKMICMIDPNLKRWVYNRNWETISGIISKKIWSMNSWFSECRTCALLCGDHYTLPKNPYPSFGFSRICACYNSYFFLI